MTAPREMTPDKATPRECDHKNTRMSEPHLAGARECNDCGMYYNPNMGGWIIKPLSESQQLAQAQQRVQELETANQWQVEKIEEWQEKYAQLNNSCISTFLHEQRVSQLEAENATLREIIAGNAQCGCYGNNEIKVQCSYCKALSRVGGKNG